MVNLSSNFIYFNLLAILINFKTINTKKRVEDFVQQDEVTHNMNEIKLNDKDDNELLDSDFAYANANGDSKQFCFTK